jgi:amino acid transporter
VIELAYSRLRRSLGLFPNYATIIGTLIGAGIFVVTGQAGAQAGPSVPIAYLVLFPVVLATAVPYMTFLSTPLGERPGGEYLDISRTSGSFYSGFMALWFKWMAYIGATGVLALSFGQYLNFFIPGVNPIFVGAVLLIIFYFTNLLGVGVYGRTEVIMTGIKLVAIAILVIPGLFTIKMSNFTPLFPFGLNGFTSILPSIFFAYAAFEAVGELSGETKDPRKTMPRVFFFGILITMIIYFLMSFVAFGNMPFISLSKSGSAMASVASHYLPFAGSAIVAIGALMAFTSAINGTFMAPPRFLMVMSEDNLLPSVFSHVNKRFKTPDFALTINLVVALFLMLTGTLQYILSITLQALFINYMLLDLALIALPFMNKKLYESAFVKPSKFLMILSAGFSFGSLMFFSYKLIFGSWELILISGLAGSSVYLYSKLKSKEKIIALKESIEHEFE